LEIFYAQLLGWKRNIEKEIHLAIPKKKRKDFGLRLGDKQLVYVDNHEFCVIEGVSKIIKELGDIKSKLSEVT
jgi:bifunctional DNA-binding transcriptional regulator/antitoxin component of YhaV-PrlF toxin-antitoxin module